MLLVVHGKSEEAFALLASSLCCASWHGTSPHEKAFASETHPDGAAFSRARGEGLGSWIHWVSASPLLKDSNKCNDGAKLAG